MILSKFFIALIASFAIFSTTYNFSGIFLYPRLCLAALGFLVAVKIFPLKNILNIFGVFFAIGFLVFFVSLVHYRFDDFILFVSLLVRGVLIPIFSAIFVIFLFDRFLYRKSSSFVTVADLFVIIIFIQIFVTLLHVADSDLRIGYLSYVNLSPIWRDASESIGFRFSGIGGISIYDTSLAYAILCSLILKRGLSQGMTPLKASILLTLSIILAAIHGRLGLIVIVFLLIPMIIFGEASNRRIKSKVWPILVKIFLLVGVLLYFFVDHQTIETVINYSSEILINFFAGDGLRSDSSDDFFENHFLWPGLLIFLLGSATWIQPGIVDQYAYSYASDSGFLLLIHYGGIFFAIIFCMMIFCIHRIYFKAFYKGSKFKIDKSFFSIYIYIVLFFSSFKGPVFISEHFMTAFFIVTGIYYKYYYRNSLM